MNILEHKKIIIAIWLIVLVASIPAIMSYSHYINYSSSTSSVINSESANAQSILNSYKQQNQSLTIFVNSSPSSIYNTTNYFVKRLISEKILGLSKISSPFSVPPYLKQEFIGKQNSSFLITLTFNVKSGFQYTNGSSPASIAYPKIVNLTKNFFGDKAYVTGNGAISYQTQEVTSKSGFAFGLIFIILIIIIFITLVSYWSSILGLIFVGISLLLGYISIFLAGLIVGKISFIVNYTLTAVVLGIATDYLVFIIARYRLELRGGKSHEAALDIAINKSGKAVLISGLTVAFTLLTFSLIPEFKDWGIVLFQAVIYTMLLNITLLPVSMYFLRKRLIMRLGLKRFPDNWHRFSLFYKTTEFSHKNAYIVAALIIVIGVIAGYFFFTIPTTYNFNTGLPSGLSSVKGLNAIESNFGSEISPVYIIDNVSLNNNTSLNVNSSLLRTAYYLINQNYIHSVNGPFISENKIDNFSSPYIFRVNKTNLYVYTLYLSVNPYSDKAINLVNKLRENKSFIVGGVTSTIIDQKNYNFKTYSELELLIVSVIFIILFISFRRVRYPIISLTGTFFSVAWSTVLMYFISYYLLKISLIYLIPIILFIILFSLGNDYTVFIISRVIEETKKNSFKEGLSKGVVTSAKTVTSLGIILAVSLGALALIPVAFLEELGIAFIISLLIDTFIIRTFYFPAMLTIFNNKH
ncbi:MAG: MMPL family transporter [Candidatus Parvarchaeota archaeon]|jgi:RND superfamily putative drug exporter|nr:MMPL family transporter [Candidatus Parvarchaeota archaeon]